MEAIVKHARKKQASFPGIASFIGTSALFAVTLAPGLYLGSYGALILLSLYSGRPVEECFFERVVIITGIVMGIVFAVSVTLLGRKVFGYVFDALLEAIHRGNSSEKPFVVKHSHIGEQDRSAIIEKLNYLRKYGNYIHSIILVGSAAYDLRQRGSDVDVVLICTDQGYEKVRDVIFQKEIDEHWNGGRNSAIEFTVLDSSLAEREFRLASPFAYSMRYGEVLSSDGYLEELIDTYPERIPGRIYVFRALYEGLAVLFLGYLKDMRKHSGTGLDQKTAGSRQERLARLIIKMIYVTLPVHGYMPLTKDDVVTLARRCYGDDTAAVLGAAIGIARNMLDLRRLDDLRAMKKLSASLFREILSMAGTKKDIVSVLRDTAGIINGHYDRVRDGSYRTCIVQ